MGCCGGARQSFPEPRSHGMAATEHGVPSREDPVTLLKLRLAKGEISVEEYERLAAVLSRSA